MSSEPTPEPTPAAAPPAPAPPAPPQPPAPKAAEPPPRPDHLDADRAWKELYAERERVKDLKAETERLRLEREQLEQRAQRQARNFDLLHSGVKNAAEKRVQRMFSREYDEEMADRPEGERVDFRTWLQEEGTRAYLGEFFEAKGAPPVAPAPAPEDDPPAAPSRSRPPVVNPNSGSSNEGSGGGGEAAMSDQELRRLQNAGRALTKGETERLNAELQRRGYRPMR